MNRGADLRPAAAVLRKFLAPPAGLEPALSAPEADALSAELRGQAAQDGRSPADRFNSTWLSGAGLLASSQSISLVCLRRAESFLEPAG
jgi:hypothetical protein